MLNPSIVLQTEACVYQPICQSVILSVGESLYDKREPETWHLFMGYPSKNRLGSKNSAFLSQMCELVMMLQLVLCFPAVPC